MKSRRVTKTNSGKGHLVHRSTATADNSRRLAPKYAELVSASSSGSVDVGLMETDYVQLSQSTM